MNQRKPTEAKNVQEEQRLVSAAEGGTAGQGTERTQQAGMIVFGYILAGITVWSLIGWALGSALGIQWLPVAGALLGLAGGIYLSFMPRFARAEPRRVDDADHDKGAGL